jgi:hypothetical protein
MQNQFIKSVALLSALIILCSCLKQSESIDPMVQVQTLAQLQREAMMATALSAGNGLLSDSSLATVQTSPKDPELFYLTLKYNIKNFNLYETANIPNSFEKLGHSFFKVFIKLFLRIKKSHTVNIDPVTLDLPDMNLDFDIVRSVLVKRVYIEYNKEFDDSVDDEASFSFINTLNMKRVSGDKSLLISYDKSDNNCHYKCLDFKISNGDIYDLLKRDSSSITVKPTLAIGALPKVTGLILDGQIELQIGLKLPF